MAKPQETPTIDQLSQRRYNLAQQLTEARARENAAALPMAVAALDRADEAMAEYAAVCESAEREAHETQRAALVTEYDRAWEANARASDEVVRARATTNAADAIAADRDLVRLARMPDGAIAMAEAVNSANSARARLSAANAKSEAAYRRFYAADRALKAFDAAHPAQA